jgi:S-(hydroxymethyl)glutathione dehydrogenase/alcohol dehydrogenase
MKAAILEKFNTPLIIDELKVPKLECGQVLVRVYSSGICGAQLGHISGVKVKQEFLPFLLGHEGGGKVLDIGEGVTTVDRGDKVVMHWGRGSGIESTFPSYERSDGTKVAAGLITTFNDHAVVSENRLTKIDDDIPFDIAALMGCSVTTGLGIINNEAKLKIGQSIVVIGVGGVGLNIIQGASLVSGYPIIGIDLHDKKLQLASNFGATHTINSSKQDISTEIKNIVGSSGIDICIDTTGRSDLIEVLHNLTKSGGKTIMVGQPKLNEHLTLHSFLQHFKGKVLMDSDGGKTDPDVDINRYLLLYKQGKLKLDDLITKRFDLIHINKALNVVKEQLDFSGRCMISMGE